MKTKIKNQKPIEIDAHFKYRCPKCGWDHWISLKETKTKNFKIVCDCNTIFKPKQIKNISINYCVKTKKIESNTKEVLIQKVDISDNNPNKQNLDKNILDQCSKLLIQYGFTNTEATKLINEAYSRTNSSNIGILVKNALESFGDNKHE